MKGDILAAHVHLETVLRISDEAVQVLIVENPAEFYYVVTELEKAFNGEESSFTFSCDGQTLAPAKCGEWIADPFHFDLNDKKIVNLLYKKLEAKAFNDKLFLFNQLSGKIVTFLEETAADFPFLLSYDEPQPMDYFKAAGVKFAKTYDSLHEKLICYINAVLELKKCEFFVLVNFKSVLSDEQLLSIYHHCQNEHVGLLLIESGKLRPLLSQEKAVIITEDLCEILENYQK